MWYQGLFEKMLAAKDQEQSKKMAAYMKDNFEFLGLKKPVLSGITKPYLSAGRKEAMDWNFVFLCWQQPFREAQYVGIDYLLKQSKKLKAEDLPNLKKLITLKSWWETVDMLDTIVGSIVLTNPQLKQEMLAWSTNENMWLRRASIDFQLKFKEETDTELLLKIIENNLNDKEFFINKAIGWSLREYSKVNPDWVKTFIEEHRGRMAPLSIREGSKYLG